MSEEKDEIKNCPFCDCRFFKGKLEAYAINKTSLEKGFVYKCPKCRTQIAIWADSYDLALEKWNTRADCVSIARLREKQAKLIEVCKALLKEVEYFNKQNVLGLYNRLIEKAKQAIEAEKSK